MDTSNVHQACSAAAENGRGEPDPDPASVEHMVRRTMRVRGVDEPLGLSVTTSVYAARGCLSTGRLPRDCHYISRQGRKLRRMLEARVTSQYGLVDVTAAATIQTAVEWLMHALKARHWLKVHYDRLSPRERLGFSREAARALETRDYHVSKLKIGPLDLQPKTTGRRGRIATPRPLRTPNNLSALSQPTTEATANVRPNPTD